MSQTDKMKELTRPSQENQGRDSSKYINAGNLEYTLKNVRTKYDFQDVQDDPVFLVSTTDNARSLLCETLTHSDLTCDLVDSGYIPSAAAVPQSDVTFSWQLAGTHSFSTLPTTIEEP